MLVLILIPVVRFEPRMQKFRSTLPPTWVYIYLYIYIYITMDAFLVSFQ